MNGHTLRVLVADDNESVRRRVCFLESGDASHHSARITDKPEVILKLDGMRRSIPDHGWR